jgi:hypothetical protein
MSLTDGSVLSALLVHFLYHDMWVHHHSMVHPQVADGGIAFNMEDSWQYIE